MSKVVTIFMLLCALSIIAAPVYAADMVKKAPMPVPLNGTEQFPDLPYQPSPQGLITQSPGDTAGFTQYDYQSNASGGRKIVVDAAGNTHVAWMNGDPFPSARYIYYNCWVNGAWTFPGGTSVSRRTGDGYTNIAITSDDRAAITYHNVTRAGGESLFVALDAFNCLGSFSYFAPPRSIAGAYVTWPQIAVDHQGFIQVTASRNTAPDAIMYSRSTNGGTTWSTAQNVDTSNTINQIIVASPVSNKVAIIYTRNNPDPVVTTASDLIYIQSTDGTTWDFRNGRVRVTNFGADQDSLGVGFDLGAVYDYNDNLHIAFLTDWQVGGSYYYYSHLMHYNATTGLMTHISDSDSVGCSPGNFGNHYMKVTMGASPTSPNHVYMTYTDWDSTDCSLNGYANGDIYIRYSSDAGATWSDSTNVTNSHTPNCDCGECDSDNWPTMAAKVDNFLHIFYVNDKDAGSIPQTEGCITDNPMLYLRYPNPLSGIDEDQNLPKDFSMSQNYPNPFNSKTNIDFRLEKNANVKLAIYDITGGLVTTLLNKRLEAGSHSINWDAANVPSGVYYYKLTTNSGTISKKMTLLK